jgi:hypothetical protein
MKKYRKKPIVIDAVRFDPSGSNRNTIARLSNVAAEPDGTLSIHTLEGVMTAYPGDWIIRGIKGEVYPCKADIFEATYEPADSLENAWLWHHRLVRLLTAWAWKPERADTTRLDAMDRVGENAAMLVHDQWGNRTVRVAIDVALSDEANVKGETQT